MKHIQEIVEFYDAIKDKNLLSETSFSMYEFFALERIIDNNTQDFKKLVEEKSFKKDSIG